MADAPAIAKSMKTVCQDLHLEHLWIIYPEKEEWRLDINISIKSINSIGDEWDYSI
jgi:hypothetical protein